MTTMRNLSIAFRNAIESSVNKELILIFATITHPLISPPIRVVTEDINGVSYLNGKPVNYKWDSGDGAGLQMYFGCPFSFTFLTDGPDPPKAKLSVANVDRKVGAAVIQLVDSPRFRFSLLKLSDYSSSVDSDNARTPTGTPTIELDAKYLFLRNVEGNDTELTADITTFDITNEPCPAIRTTKDRTPGLYL